MNKWNHTLPNKEGDTDILKFINKKTIIDSEENRIPIYMFMLMYSNYNLIRGSQGPNVERSVLQNYNEYRLFYIEFLIIDALINNMVTVTSNQDDDKIIDITGKNKILDTFIKEYSFVFAPSELYTHTNYLPEVHRYISDHSTDDTSRGGAPPVGRDTSRFTPGPAPGTRMGTRMKSYMMPTNIAIDPTNVLSEHVMRIMNDDSSNLSFKVDVHVILAPGDSSIGIGDKVGYACESSRQEMSRSWSEISGNPYYPTPRKE
jgi:hypothetical protein